MFLGVLMVSEAPRDAPGAFQGVLKASEAFWEVSGVSGSFIGRSMELRVQVILWTILGASVGFGGVPGMFLVVS